jgi:DNA topoisomerase-6 subunit B
VRKGARSPAGGGATAEALATAQREIAVSEFFAKNRHLLGFDSPRRALLTTVKEAVDNALDACEEAGILPELWIDVHATGVGRYEVSVQDNGPGIVRRQIPLIFGKLLYGSKFHRLRMSRGQQGIGISAAGLYGALTTGRPVRIVSKVAARKPAHHYEIEIDTRRNRPEVHNGRGQGVDIPPGEKGRQYMLRHGIRWVSRYPETAGGGEVETGTRVTIELEARHHRGHGSVAEYLEQTAIANPHATIHYRDPDGEERTWARSAARLPVAPREVKPHPYGIDFGQMLALLRDTGASTVARFLATSFSRVSPSLAGRVCAAAGIAPRTPPPRLSRKQVEALYRALRSSRIAAPPLDCIAPIGEDVLLRALRELVPGEFYAAATRTPAVYRGNPFQIEVALAYGGAAASEGMTLDDLGDGLAETDARTLRGFLLRSFDGRGSDVVDRVLVESGLDGRRSPAGLDPAEATRLHAAMRAVAPSDGRRMQVLRYANRVPLQFQPAACAITQAVLKTNWRSYGLPPSQGTLPAAPVTVLVHVASVWVPFTSESKEAIAAVPEVERELRLALQVVGRKLARYLRRGRRTREEGERRNVFLRYLGEVALAAGALGDRDPERLRERLAEVARRRTAAADVVLDERGRPAGA